MCRTSNNCGVVFFVHNTLQCHLLKSCVYTVYCILYTYICKLFKVNFFELEYKNG